MGPVQTDRNSKINSNPEGTESSPFAPATAPPVAGSQGLQAEPDFEITDGNYTKKFPHVIRLAPIYDDGILIGHEEVRSSKPPSADKATDPWEIEGCECCGDVHSREDSGRESNEAEEVP